MTGYGAHTAKNGDLSITIEIKSVNSRYTDLTVNFPPIFSSYEKDVEDRVRSTIVRGKINVNMVFESPRSNFEIPDIDYSQLDTLFMLCNKLKQRYEIHFSPTFSDILSFPGILRIKENRLAIDSCKESILSSVDQALKNLLKSRKKEALLAIFKKKSISYL
jgi:uncharacterized protein (TIGR00255 family)